VVDACSGLLECDRVDIRRKELEGEYKRMFFQKLD
jgi:hypothetical protein